MHVQDCTVLRAAQCVMCTLQLPYDWEKGKAAMREPECEDTYWTYLETIKQSTVRQKTKQCIQCENSALGGRVLHQAQNPLRTWAEMQIDRSLMPTLWKSIQNLRGRGEQSTLSHASLWKSSICELGRRRGAYTLQKVICYFKFLITKVIHTVGNTLLFSRQLKETPWKAQKWEDWAFRTMQRSVKKLISTWILKSSLYNLGQMEVKCCEKSSRSAWRNAKNNNLNFTFVKYLNRCIVIFLLY